MQKSFKILVKDLSSFVKTNRVLFASGDGKQLHVALRAGPNVERYFVSHGTDVTLGFRKKNDAVKYFNSL